MEKRTAVSVTSGGKVKDGKGKEGGGTSEESSRMSYLSRLEMLSSRNSTSLAQKLSASCGEKVSVKTSLVCESNELTV